MRNKPGIDLVLMAAVTLLLVPAVVFSPSNIPRIVLGLPFVLFFPGYSLVSALFPAKSLLGAVERAAYSLALSIALVALTGLLLNYVWSITLYPMLGSLTLMILALSAAAWYRRRNLPEEEKTYLRLRLDFGWRRAAVTDRVLWVCLAVVLAGAVIVSVHTYQKNQQGFTEFYLLGAQGMAADYPQQLSVGEEGRFTMTVVNRERTAETYLIRVLAEDCRVRVDGEERPEISLALEHTAQQTFEVEFFFTAPGEGKKLEFNLYRADDPEVYLRTYLKVMVE